MIITIDGPVASGKSTIARLLARDLHFFYINSGLLFRALAYIVLRDEHMRIEQLARLTEQQIAGIDFAQLRYVVDAGHEQIFYKDENITSELKSDTVAQAASIVATNSAVRLLILEYERMLAAQSSVVADGRDMGTVVFPHADIKIYLTATPEVRAQRWQLDQEKRGNKLTFEQAIDEITSRDNRDKKRVVALLCVPAGAQVIDSSALSIKEVLAAIKKLIT